MKRIHLNLDWKFTEGEISNMPGMKKPATGIHLPHDFMISKEVCPDAACGAEGGFYPECVGTYEKELELTEADMTETMLLSFEGCFGKTRVLVNGNPAGVHHYGYTPFTVDIRPFVHPGKNHIMVVVHLDDAPNGRWYSGAGLYRDVELLQGPALHVAHNGLFVYTKHVAEQDALLCAELTLVNDKAKATGYTEAYVCFTCREKTTGRVAAVRRQKVMMRAGTQKTIPQTMMIEQAKLWSPQEPELYTMEATVYEVSEQVVQISYNNREHLEEPEKYLDSISSVFGIRTVTADAKHGLLLNGVPIKLKGGCIHHDNGLLGACSYYDAEYRKVKLHKEMGYNALRLAHNPQSSQLLDICDELGMIVMDEAFDVWNMNKNTFDFGNHFTAEWKQELEAMMHRDRNHPSILFWSIGNELPEQGGLAEGYETSEMLAKFVRSQDSSRLVCGALCSFFRGLNDEDNASFWKALQEEMAAGGSVINMDNSFGRAIWPEYTGPFAKDWDVVGYNYLSYQFMPSHELFPDRVICTTESKPGEFEEYWKATESLPYVIGDFLWTSMDYIGEAGIGKCAYVTPEKAASAARMLNYTTYPWRLANAGDFDLCGNLKPQGVYHRIIWGSDETYIFSHNPANFGKVELIGRYGWPEGGNHWTWDAAAGSRTKVEVYSRGEEVELWLNGKSLGRMPAGEEHHFKAVFEVGYEPGELTAVSYTDGKEVSRDQVKTAGKAEGLRITMEKETIKADGRSLAYGTVEIVDAQGNAVPTAEDVKATARVEGAAELVAFGTGRGATEENYTTGVFTSYQGKWQVILCSGTEAGEAELVVEAEGLGSASARVLVE